MLEVFMAIILFTLGLATIDFFLGEIDYVFSLWISVYYTHHLH